MFGCQAAYAAGPWSSPSHTGHWRSEARPGSWRIVNVTPDSFYDRGLTADPAAAVARGLELVAAGADLLDIGGMTAQPGDPITVAAEIDRVVPVVRELRGRVDVPIAVDTYRAEVAAAALAAGADLVNDHTGLSDPELAGGRRGGRRRARGHAPRHRAEAGAGRPLRRAVRAGRRDPGRSSPAGPGPPASGATRSSSTPASASGRTRPPTSRPSAACPSSARSATRCCSRRRTRR